MQPLDEFLLAVVRLTSFVTNFPITATITVVRLVTFVSNFPITLVLGPVNFNIV